MPDNTTVPAAGLSSQPPSFSPSSTSTPKPTSNTANDVLGVVYLPASPGTPVGTFDFIVDLSSNSQVEISTPVAADTQEGTVVGVVVDMRTVGTSKDPVAADLSASHSPSQIGFVSEVVVATVQVFHSNALRPVRSGVVRAASEVEMLQATGFYKMDWPLPAGVVPLADGTFSRVCFDGPATLGPESAHVMIAGLSGQAAKTSYAGVLLRSAIHAGSPAEHSTAALLFNVKGTDLLYLDKPPSKGYELSDQDKAMYRAMGVPATPFEDVTVYAASLPGGSHSRSDRQDAALLRWGLTEIWNYLRYFWPWLYEDDKTSSFISSFEEVHLHARSAHVRIDTFKKMFAWFDQEIATAEEHNSSECFGGRTHIATMRKMRRLFKSLPEKCGGLLTVESSSSRDDVPHQSWSHGQVVVVDIAGLSPQVQAVVIARTCERLLKSAEGGQLGVDHLVVLADELNAFAPAVGGDMTAVRKILQRISTQGRYAGISLWGAAQKLSKVDEMVRDNAATRVAGVLADSEASSGVYGRLSSGLTERLVTLPKGQVALWHYSFRSALVARFPRPAWRTGKAKTSGSKATVQSVLADANSLTEKSIQRLSEGIPDEVVERVVASEDDPASAAEVLEGLRVVDMSKTALHEPSTFDPNDPFSLGE